MYSSPTLRDKKINIPKPIQLSITFIIKNNNILKQFNKKKLDKYNKIKKFKIIITSKIINKFIICTLFNKNFIVNPRKHKITSTVNFNIFFLFKS